MDKITMDTYTLNNESGGWLAQIVITSDGMFSAVSDWGNFAFAWRSSYKEKTFKDFLMSLHSDYFASKMIESMSYIATGTRVDAACNRFSKRVLPPLQETLKREAQET